MFIITKDFINEVGEEVVGLRTRDISDKYGAKYVNDLLTNTKGKDGKRKFTDKQIQKIRSKMPFRFRLLDGDQEVYFEGYSNDDNSFDPLDNFGRGYGCTQIDYFYKKGGWQEL